MKIRIKTKVKSGSGYLIGGNWSHGEPMKKIVIKTSVKAGSGYLGSGT